MPTGSRKIRDLGRKVEVLRLCPRCAEFMGRAGIWEEKQIEDNVLGEKHARSPDTRGQVWAKMKTGTNEFRPEHAARLFQHVLGIADVLSPECLYWEFDKFLQAIDDAGLRTEPTVFGGFYELWRRAEPWDGLKFVTQPGDVRGGFSGDDDNVEPVLTVGEHAAIMISRREPGYLVLIECGPKEITCLVPSPRQPEIELSKDGIRLPRHGYIKIGTQGGAPFATYWLIAAITSERPKLPTWVQPAKSDANQRVLALNGKQQKELAGILVNSKGLKLYQKHYAVIDPAAAPHRGR